MIIYSQDVAPTGLTVADLLNSLGLIGISLVILWQACQRMFHQVTLATVRRGSGWHGDAS